MNYFMRFCFLWILLAAFCLFASPARSETTHQELEFDIARTGIEQLLAMNVTSVSKVAEKLWQAPSAIYVLTNEKIRRSGATTIPEVLRLVPGVQVARLDANKWAVSVRGFNSRTANKLLVLIDGRNIYDPLFSGVVWESKYVMLEDVDRIEVIRGPGGTLWGVNAVNGVINIITKTAKETQGGLLTGGGGTEERGFGSFRYGTELGDSTFARGYALYQNRDAGYLSDFDPQDNSQFAQAGFRLDSQLSKREAVSISGNAYYGEQGAPNSALASDNDTAGVNLLASWSREFSETSKLSALGYYDHTEFDTQFLGEVRDSAQVELQYDLVPNNRHRFVSGMNYRISTDHIRNSELLSMDPQARTDHFINAFAEDRIELSEKTLYLTIGSKLSQNTYTGLEVQPTARLAWLINEGNSMWFAISRAVRIPSRSEDDIRIRLSPDLSISGNRRLDSEELIAYETGYRTQPIESLALDLTVFYNDYDNLLSVEGDLAGNRGQGETYGLESVATLQAASGWNLEGSFSVLRMHLDLEPGSLSPPATYEDMENSNPKQQFSLRSLLDLGEQWELDCGLRYVDNLSAQNVKSYIVGDARLGYRVSEKLELSLVGQNLFAAHHFEQGPRQAFNVTEVQQGVYAKARFTF